MTLETKLETSERNAARARKNFESSIRIAAPLLMGGAYLAMRGGNHFPPEYLETV